MKYFYLLLLLITLTIACKEKALSGKRLEDKLKATMTGYLDSTFKSGTKAAIQNMSYYADKSRNSYLCRFTVNFKINNHDSTGVMTAIIPDDFSTITASK
ncbi:MAG TPA: hypothetical protein VG847_05330 [Chitinophagaceae bacterium]|nr:hypothetical protein [Chitinophagaceae bacterium]